jgi:hypothetical protein
MIGPLIILIKNMTYKKTTLITTLVWLIMLIFIFASCSPQTYCGTKGQHKARQVKTKKMAPSMAN